MAVVDSATRILVSFIDNYGCGFGPTFGVKTFVEDARETLFLPTQMSDPP